MLKPIQKSVDHRSDRQRITRIPLGRAISATGDVRTRRHRASIRLLDFWRQFTKRRSFACRLVDQPRPIRQSSKPRMAAAIDAINISAHEPLASTSATHGCKILTAVSDKLDMTAQRPRSFELFPYRRQSPVYDHHRRHRDQQSHELRQKRTDASPSARRAVVPVRSTVGFASIPGSHASATIRR